MLEKILKFFKLKINWGCCKSSNLLVVLSFRMNLSIWLTIYYVTQCWVILLNIISNSVLKWWNTLFLVLVMCNGSSGCSNCPTLMISCGSSLRSVFSKPQTLLELRNVITYNIYVWFTNPLYFEFKCIVENHRFLKRICVAFIWVTNFFVICSFIS